MIKKKGFKYIENDKENIKSFIRDVEKIINKNFKSKNNYNSLSFNNFNKIVYKTQNEINKKYNPIYFANKFSNIFNKA